VEPNGFKEPNGAQTLTLASVTEPRLDASEQGSGHVWDHFFGKSQQILKDS
jgi:hypothetical protein